MLSLLSVNPSPPKYLHLNLENTVPEGKEKGLKLDRWYTANSPVVDHDAHHKEVFQKPNPRILNEKDFHRHELASQGGLAACTHGERVLNVPREGSASQQSQTSLARCLSSPNKGNARVKGCDLKVNHPPIRLTDAYPRAHRLLWAPKRTVGPGPSVPRGVVEPAAYVSYI